MVLSKVQICLELIYQTSSDLIHIYNVDWLRTPNDLRLFAGYLATVQEFPFSKPELINYLEYEYHQVLKLDDLDLQEKTKKIYRYITNFMMKIKNFISDDDFE